MDNLRTAKIERKTSEVSIVGELNIDGTGKSVIDTGINFLDHMLITLAKHSLIDITLKGTGDLKHHVSEDVALAFGQAFRESLSNYAGIKRFGSVYVPMDEAAARAIIDLGGRDYCVLELHMTQTQIEDLQTEDITHFFQSFAQASKANVHIHILYGNNEHHKIEAATKALALALREAVTLEPRLKGTIPSAKGVL